MILHAATPYSDLTAGDVTTVTDLRSEPTRKIPVPVDTGAVNGSEVRDQVSLSQEGIQRSRKNRPESPPQSDDRNPTSRKSDTGPARKELSAEEKQVVQELKNRDREVRNHEQAHLANAGQYATGGPSYTYQTGPDGRRYAVGGEVPIDVSKEKTPEQTVQKMRTVRRAALAPAHPSGADLSIAATASMKEAQAMREMNARQENENASPAAANNAENSSARDSSSGNKSTEPAPAQPVRRQNFQAIYA